MKKVRLKSDSGITIIPLIVILIVIGILTTVLVTKIDIGIDIRNYNYMCADIELLENKIMTYYNENGSIPITGGAVSGLQLGSEKNSRDNNNYYVIDLAKLYNMSLNFGGGNVTDKDVYIINEQSHKVYYLKGVVYEGKTYYTNSL